MSHIKQETSENDDDDYEDMYVYMDFGANLPYEELTADNLQIKMIGTHTDHPIVQVNSRFFKGTYDYAMGTHTFFSESKTPMATDPNFQKVPAQSYEYCHKTNKVLQMRRIFVAPKEDDEDGGEAAAEDMSKYEVHQTYSQALGKLLKPGERPPRLIDAAQNGAHLVKRRTKKKKGLTQIDSDMEVDDPADRDYEPRGQVGGE